MTEIGLTMSEKVFEYGKQKMVLNLKVGHLKREKLTKGFIKKIEDTE